MPSANRLYPEGMRGAGRGPLSAAPTETPQGPVPSPPAASAAPPGLTREAAAREVPLVVDGAVPARRGHVLLHLRRRHGGAGR